MFLLSFSLFRFTFFCVSPLSHRFFIASLTSSSPPHSNSLPSAYPFLTAILLFHFPGNDDRDDIFRINDDIFRINDDTLVIDDDINIEETLECIEEAIEKIPDDCLECIGVAALSFALTALADGDAAAADTPIDDSAASELLGGLTAEIQEICFISLIPGGGGGGGRGPLAPGKDPDPVPDSPSGDPSKDPEPDSRSEDSATSGGDEGSDQNDLILNGTSGGASSGGWNSFVALALSLSLVLGVAFMY